MQYIFQWVHFKSINEITSLLDEAGALMSKSEILIRFKIAGQNWYTCYIVSDLYFSKKTIKSTEGLLFQNYNEKVKCWVFFSIFLSFHFINVKVLIILTIRSNCLLVPFHINILNWHYKFRCSLLYNNLHSIVSNVKIGF